MHTQTPNPGLPPPKEGRPWIVLGVVVSALLLLGNLVAYFVYVRSGDEKGEPVPARAVDSTAIDEARSPPPPLPPPPEPSSLAELARAQRKAGVEAIKQGNYRKAITSLEAAATLDPELAEVTSLLEVARKLGRAQDEARKQEREDEREARRNATTRRSTTRKNADRLRVKSEFRTPES